MPPASRDLQISAPSSQVRVELSYRDKGELLKYVDDLNAGGGVPRWQIQDVRWAGQGADAELTATLTVAWE